MNIRIISAVALGAVVASNIASVIAILGLRSSVSEINKKLESVNREVEDLKHQIEEQNRVRLIKTNRRIKITEQEKLCLARNVFFEAGVEPHEGKIAVAQVTYNRLKTGRWGRNFCDVVYARSQFSWTLNKSKRWKTPSGKLWESSLRAVEDFRGGVRIQELENSMFYHADYVEPYWKDPSKKIVQVGRHIFYSDALRRM